MIRLAGALVAAAVLGAGCASEVNEAGVVAGPPEGQARALQLVDVAREVGLDFRHGAFRERASADPVAMTGGGLCWLDYDGDGLLDLFVANGFAQADRDDWAAAGGLPTTRLFRNLGGRFDDVGDESGTALPVRGQGCVAADLDLDGHTDLFVTTAERSLLLWNLGDGTFREAGPAAGVAVYGWHTGAAVGDVDGNGWPDLFVAGYVDLNNRIPEATLGFPNTYRGVRDLLFLGNGPDASGRVTFREVGAEAGLEVARFEYGLGALFSDLDRDGDPDLYVANDTNPNRLYENVPWPGGAAADPAGLGFRFEERAAAAGVADANSGMGVAAGDYDGDGLSDLFVTNARLQTHAAYRALPPDERAPSFADVRAELGPSFTGSTGWGIAWADLDLDADLDLLLANGDIPVTDLAGDAELVQLFENLGESRFEPVRVGLRPLLARGSAAADYDDDGDVDVAIVDIGGQLVLLENRGAGGNWLEVELGEFAPGAEVTAVLPDGRELRREARAGGSYLSSEDPRLHFGLGHADAVRELVVRWPGGRVTRMADVEANRLVVVEPPG